MPILALADLTVDLVVALLGTAGSWPLLLLVLLVVVPAVWSRDTGRRHRARQVLRLLRSRTDDEPVP
ncbi:hypothetical protein ACFWTE_11750 [Nocardiopsis sp. NPDC058631]|uniref:hypothetical protein n=1 Tax=Nocardiopsis sp. NPDC058631 TaxID=3346566 RepID=UPI00365F5566